MRGRAAAGPQPCSGVDGAGDGEGAAADGVAADAAVVQATFEAEGETVYVLGEIENRQGDSADPTRLGRPAQHIDPKRGSVADTGASRAGYGVTFVYEGAGSL